MLLNKLFATLLKIPVEEHFFLEMVEIKAREYFYKTTQTTRNSATKSMLTQVNTNRYFPASEGM